MTISRVSFSYPAAVGLAALLIASHLHAAAGMPHAPLPPLHAAASAGNVQDMQALVAHGEDIHALNAQGETVLHRAAHGGHADAITYALGQGVAVDHIDGNGDTALSEAVTFHYFECVKRLIRPLLKPI